MTPGDKLAQAYRNRAAMARVYASAVLNSAGMEQKMRQAVYWTPMEFR